MSTLNRAVLFEGPCLHRGGNSRVRVDPFEPGYWVRGHPAERPVLLTPRRYRSDYLTSGIVLDMGPRLLCPEHLLAACVLTGMDSVCVTLEDGPRELPVGPSEASFTETLSQNCTGPAGPVTQTEIVRPVQLGNDAEGWSFVAKPGVEPFISVSWDQGTVTRATVRSVDADTLRDLGRSRTFLAAEDIRHVVSHGRYRGLAESCDWVRVVPRADLCRPDHLLESARHKMYDLIGDLAVLGGVPKGSIHAANPGHRRNEILRKTLEQNLLPPGPDPSE